MFASRITFLTILLLLLIQYSNKSQKNIPESTSEIFPHTKKLFSWDTKLFSEEEKKLKKREQFNFVRKVLLTYWSCWTWSMVWLLLFCFSSLFDCTWIDAGGKLKSTLSLSLIWFCTISACIGINFPSLNTYDVYLFLLDILIFQSDFWLPLLCFLINRLHLTISVAG